MAKYYAGASLNIMATLPAHYERDIRWALKTPYATAANRYTLLSPNRLTVNVGDLGYALISQTLIDLSVAASWDSIATDYTVAANRAGKDFYVYACQQAGSTPKLLLSANATFPAGYTASNSRKIAGFHCLSVAVGIIGGHTLTGFVAGDILPASVWDLKHRPHEASPEGMVYSDQIGKWVDIYLASGTGASTASVNGGTISDTRTWNDFVDDGAAVKKRFLRDAEFQIIAAGSNEQTTITGSVDPVTTGGHVDTAARRMISNIGCEDCAGAMYQWLDEQSFQCNPDGTVGAAGLTYTVYYAASPGGNPVYLKQGADSVYYLASNMATATADRYAGPTNYKFPIKHEAAAATGAIAQVYYYNAGTHPARLIANISTITKDVFLPTNNPAYFLQVAHNVNAATTGVALNYDDGADNRLESVVPGAANGAGDLALNSQAFSWKVIGGSKGQLWSQGTYGDTKLLAGAYWSIGSYCGSRCRSAFYSRWGVSMTVGMRFAAEPE